MPILLPLISGVSQSGEVIPSIIPTAQKDIPSADRFTLIQPLCGQWHCLVKCLNKGAHNRLNTEFKSRLFTQRMKSLILVSLCFINNHAIVLSLLVYKYNFTQISISRTTSIVYTRIRVQSLHIGTGRIGRITFTHCR